MELIVATNFGLNHVLQSEAWLLRTVFGIVDVWSVMEDLWLK